MKKIIKSSFIFVVIIFGVLLFLELIPTAPKFNHDNPWIIEDGERPLVIPHRGAKDLYPENTIYSYDKLDEDGYDVFEIDLSITKDGILVTHHDVFFINDQGEEKKIREIDYNDLILEKTNFAKDFVNLDNEKEFENVVDTELLAKLKPAKLEDLFKKYKDKLYILELKDTVESSGDVIFEKAVDKLITLVEEYEMEENIIVSSFDDKITELIRKESNNKIYTSTATKETFNFVIYNTLRIDFFYKPKDIALILPVRDDLSDSQRKLIEKAPGFLRNQITTYDSSTDTYYTKLVKQGIIDDAHRHNMAILYWTVNDKDLMIKLIKMGVDGIITDRPDILKEVYDELGM